MTQTTLIECPRTKYILFFFNDTATTEIYSLSLHDALPISPRVFCTIAHLRARFQGGLKPASRIGLRGRWLGRRRGLWQRSEEHTSELQSQSNLVCRLLLEKKTAM